MARLYPLGPLRLSILAAAGLTSGLSAAALSGCGSDVKVLDNDGAGGESTGSSGGSGNTGAVEMVGGASTGGASTGGAGGKGGDGASAGEGGAGGQPGLCEGATPVLSADGTDSGFAQCPDGTIHRLAPATCSAEIGEPACAGTEDFLDCTTDAECNAGPNGKCISFEAGFKASTYCGCAYSCADDADCGDGEICLCDGVVDSGVDYATCVPANCETGADCASGECGIESFFDGCSWDVRLQCRSTTDVCRTDDDCAGECVIDAASQEWGCQFQNCAIGRPLLIDGAARVANSELRSDWQDVNIALDVSALSPDERSKLTAYWRQVAALEHASVASFARFTLELMALGAPPEFLAEAQRASSDEVQHARIAYALCSAYAGEPVGPTALDLSDLSWSSDRADAMERLIREACVGETVGVAEALHAAEQVEDDVLRATLTRVAEDEQRHAELAWRVLRWLMQDASAVTKARAQTTFDEAIASVVDVGEQPDVDGVPAHGMLPSSAVAAVRAHAVSTVVRPCFEAMLQAV